MPQPEALRRASSLTVAPLFLSTRNHVNSEKKKKKVLRKAHREGLCWEHEPKPVFLRDVLQSRGFLDVEMFHKTHFFFLSLTSSVFICRPCECGAKGRWGSKVRALVKR